MNDEPDPVVERRQSIRRLVVAAKRIGYSMLLVSILGFVGAVVSDFARWAVVLTVASLVASIIVLPMPIVLGYGLRAAERDDRARRVGTTTRPTG